MLEPFGLDESVEAIYFALIAQPESDVADLAAKSGRDECTVRTALAQLARLSLLRSSWRDPEVLRPVRPDLALETLLARQEADLAQRQTQVAESRAAAAVLLAEYAIQHPDPSVEASERLIGVDAVHHRLRELAYEATHELISFVQGGAHSAQSMLASGPRDEQVLKRGLDVRTIYLDSVGNDPATSAYADWLTKVGGQVRTAPTLPLGMVIVDRERALITIDAEDRIGGAVLIREESMVTALCALFDQTWAVARPLGAPAAHDERGLTGQERELLRLLYLGYTDAAVARKLGISTRTSRRVTAGLISRLGARSRFQAGARAAERGWFAAADRSPQRGG
jgi:DNA-binding CsgD family transcriptional regulator